MVLAISSSQESQGLQPSVFDCPLLNTALIDAQRKSTSQNLTPKTAAEFWKKLPSAETHLHGGACTDILTSVEIAWEASARTDQELQKKFSSKDELVQKLLETKPGSLSAYFEKYHLIRDRLFTTLEDIERVSREGAWHAFEHGTHILEIRTSIKSGVHGDPASKHLMGNVSFTPEDEFRAMVRGFQAAEKASLGKLHVFVIISFRRGESVATSLAMLEEARKLRQLVIVEFGKDYIVGIDMNGQEFGHQYKAKLYKSVYQKAREYDFKLTAHSGEEVDEGAILHCVDHLGVDRIGHGSSLHLPTPLLKKNVVHKRDGIIKNAFIRILQEGVPLEMCLSSNIQTGARYTKGYQQKKGARPTPLLDGISDASHYPFKMLMALGDLVSPGHEPLTPLVATDGIFSLNTNAAREYSLVAQAFSLSVPVILGLAYSSIRHSFASPAVQNQVIEESWLPFAKAFLCDERFSDPVAEMQHHVQAYRDQLKEELGITPVLLNRIQEEVFSPQRYFLTK